MEIATPEQAIALALCGTRRRRAQLEGLMDHALAAADFALVAEHLNRQRLLPLVGSRLVELRGDALPAWFTDLVHAAVEASAKVAMVQAMVLMQVQSALESAGIPALPIKGPQLARAVYGNVGLRQSSDLDVLVPVAQLDDAVRVLLPLGYVHPRDPLGRDGLPLLHLGMAHPDGLPDVELHWRVHWYEDRFAADMLGRSAPTAEGRDAEPVHQFVTLLLLFARDGFAGLRMAADIAAWWDVSGHGVPDGALDAVALRYPALGPAVHTAAVTARRLVGAPDWLPSPAGSAVARRTVPRLADWALIASDQQIAATASLVDGLLTPRGGVRAFVRRALVPRAEVIAFREPDLAPRGPLALPLGRLQVAPRVLRRYAIALWAVRWGRRWPPPVPATVAATAAGRET